jgi:hypothetical protein
MSCEVMMPVASVPETSIHIFKAIQPNFSGVIRLLTCRCQNPKTENGYTLFQSILLIVMSVIRGCRNPSRQVAWTNKFFYDGA